MLFIPLSAALFPAGRGNSGNWIRLYCSKRKHGKGRAIAIWLFQCSPVEALFWKYTCEIISIAKHSA